MPSDLTAVHGIPTLELQAAGVTLRPELQASLPVQNGARLVRAGLALSGRDRTGGGHEMGNRADLRRPLGPDNLL